MKVPATFEIKEVADALGLVLVDEQDRTLYSATGSPSEVDAACKQKPCAWSPVAAPQVAVPVGEFDFVVRDDGIRQWTWRGRALYSYAGDFAAGFANGMNASGAMEVAYVLRYFMPPEVTVQDTHRLGRVLADSQGKSLYRRDAFIFQSGSGHGLRRGSPVRPAVGRDLGVNPRCVDDCSERWRPFLAPANAKPSGYWSVYERADGSKQWAYQGFALWTYAGDTQPGDINGNDSFQLAIAERRNTVVDIGTPYDGSTALYWAAAIP
jgi:predicted lipoprotein with Yx(FWY)xxD motif